MVVDESNGALLGEVKGIRGAHGTAVASSSGAWICHVRQRPVRGDVRSENLRRAWQNSGSRRRGRDHLRRGVEQSVHVQRRRAFVDGDRSAAGHADHEHPARRQAANTARRPATARSTRTSLTRARWSKSTQSPRPSLDGGPRRRASSRCRWPSTPRITGCSAGVAAACWRCRTIRPARSWRPRRLEAASTEQVSTAASGDAFASNVDGTLTVIHQDSPDQCRVIQTIETPQGSRNMGLDPTNHRVFIVSAKFGPVPANGQRPGPGAARHVRADGDRALTRQQNRVIE